MKPLPKGIQLVLLDPIEYLCWVRRGCNHGRRLSEPAPQQTPSDEGPMQTRALLLSLCGTKHAYTNLPPLGILEQLTRTAYAITRIASAMPPLQEKSYQ